MDRAPASTIQTTSPLRSPAPRRTPTANDAVAAAAATVPPCLALFPVPRSYYVSFSSCLALFFCSLYLQSSGVFSALSSRAVLTNKSLLLFLGAAAIADLCISLDSADHCWRCPAGVLCFVDWGIEVQAVVLWSLVVFQSSVPSAAQQKYSKYCGRARRNVADRKAVQQTAATAPA